MVWRQKSSAAKTALSLTFALLFCHCWINQAPSHLLLLHTFSHLLVSPIHQVVWTGKPGLMPFTLLALIPSIISQLVLPGFLINMSLLHSFCLFIVPKISFLFLDPKYYSCLLQIDPSHSHQNGPLKMQVKVGWGHIWHSSVVPFLL